MNRQERDKLTMEELEDRLQKVPNDSGLSTADCAEVLAALATGFRMLADDEAREA